MPSFQNIVLFRIQYIVKLKFYIVQCYFVDYLLKILFKIINVTCNKIYDSFKQYVIIKETKNEVIVPIID